MNERKKERTYNGDELSINNPLETQKTRAHSTHRESRRKRAGGARRGRRRQQPRGHGRTAAPAVLKAPFYIHYFIINFCCLDRVAMKQALQWASERGECEGVMRAAYPPGHHAGGHSCCCCCCCCLLPPVLCSLLLLLLLLLLGNAKPREDLLRHDADVCLCEQIDHI